MNAGPQRQYQVGIDIGGTFTDGVISDLETGQTATAKVLTTPADPSIGFLDALRALLVAAGAERSQVAAAMHATTVATNAIIEKKTAKTALLTTKGFRDVLAIQRKARNDLYDLSGSKPEPLVGKAYRVEIDERLDSEGRVIRALDEQEVRDRVRELLRAGVEALAICFLHSYSDARHEEAAQAIACGLAPDLSVSISAEVSPRSGEYFRTSTTVINASLIPLVGRYLSRIEAGLASESAGPALFVMQSSGGLADGALMKRFPCRMIESGPAAGVAATVKLASIFGVSDFVTFDMGGTTAKASLVLGGEPEMAEDAVVGQMVRPGARSSDTGGYPVRVPVVGLVEVGAGGGSIAWIDEAGGLRVGPQSAGADPGPACYGHGGREPTVTDANLVLGRLNPDYFLGGHMTLDVDASFHAIKERCADGLGRSVVDTAAAILEIADSHMMRALRVVSVERGRDPRDLSLMAFGGAGPLHANALARELGVPRVVIPPNAGVASALGLLLADSKVDHSMTYRTLTSARDQRAVDAIFERLSRNAEAQLTRQGAKREEVVLTRSVEMHYRGQAHELRVPWPASGTRAAALDETFHAEHVRAFGHRSWEHPTEITALVLSARADIHKPRVARHEATRAKGAPRTREVFFGDAFVACAIHDRQALDVGTVVHGPSIVEADDSTIVVLPEYQALVGEYGELYLDIASS